MPQITSQYREGQRVRIVKNLYSHCFRIGQIVTLISSSHGGWRGNSIHILGNYIKEEEFEAIAPASPKTDDKTKCCHCEGEFNRDDIHLHDGSYYCESCESECFSTCDHCGYFHSVDDTFEVDDSFYCSERCIQRAGYVECSDCSDWHSSDDTYLLHNGNRICSSCSDNYRNCEQCGDMFHYDNLDENYCCSNCQSSRIIKDYDWQPKEFVFDKMPWENTIYLGIELEVECGDKNCEDMAEKVMVWLEKNKVQDRVYIKDDGSLNNGFELVWMPSTLQAIHKRFPMHKFLKYLGKLGLKSHDVDNCGLHVHISRKKLTARDLWAGKLFFWKCQPQLLQFSARGSTSYCKFDTSMPVNGTRQKNGRYSAFNTSATTNTVEIRVFRGTLKYDRFLASLQFSDLFAEYIQNVSVPMVRDRDTSRVWQEFLDYAKKKNKYNQFLTYVKKRGIV